MTINRERLFNVVRVTVRVSWEVRLKAGYDGRVAKGVRSTFEPSKHQPAAAASSLLFSSLLFSSRPRPPSIRNRRWDSETCIGSSNSLSLLYIWHTSVVLARLARATAGEYLSPGAAWHKAYCMCSKYTIAAGWLRRERQDSLPSGADGLCSFDRNSTDPPFALRARV